MEGHATLLYSHSKNRNRARADKGREEKGGRREREGGKDGGKEGGLTGVTESMNEPSGRLLEVKGVSIDPSCIGEGKEMNEEEKMQLTEVEVWCADCLVVREDVGELLHSFV